MILPTECFCAACGERGVTARLSQDLDTGQYGCPNGHVTAEPGRPMLVDAPELPAEVPTAIPASAEAALDKPDKPESAGKPPSPTRSEKAPQAQQKPQQPGNKAAVDTVEAVQAEAGGELLTPEEAQRFCKWFLKYAGRGKKAKAEAEAGCRIVEEILASHSVQREFPGIENLPDYVDNLKAEIVGLRTESERLQVQLACCLTAAEGHTQKPAKQGDYGWSLAYQAVLDLRLHYDLLREHEAMKAKQEVPSAPPAPSGLSIQAPPNDRPISDFRPVSTPLPGGEALVMLRLSEPALTAIRVEAENQGQPWEQFLEAHLNYAVVERGGAF